jgi:hypothetical protein
MFQTLRFEREGERFCLTLVNSRPDRIGLDLNVPHVGRMNLAITLLQNGRLRFDVCREPERCLATIEQVIGKSLCIEATDGNFFRVLVVQAAYRFLELDLLIPAIGELAMTFKPSADRTRMEIVADRRIRILPTNHYQTSLSGRGTSDIRGPNTNADVAVRRCFQGVRGVLYNTPELA